MDADELTQLEPVAAVYEETDSTAERLRVLCQLAESLDDDEIQSLKSDAEHAFGYPSMAKMERATARSILDRITAVQNFRADLEQIHEQRV